MGKKYLITGASGFIGTHLIERLLSTESTIICIDRSFSDAFDFKFSRYFNHKIIKLELNILDENVVKNIIDSHNGTIKYETGKKGTTFIVTLEI